MLVGDAQWSKYHLVTSPALRQRCGNGYVGSFCHPKFSTCSQGTITDWKEEVFIFPPLKGIPGNDRSLDDRISSINFHIPKRSVSQTPMELGVHVIPKYSKWINLVPSIGCTKPKKVDMKSWDILGYIPYTLLKHKIIITFQKSLLC